MTSLSHANLADATSIHKAQNYRPDIDGLRAIAVLAVILYHFKVPFFSGGFVGVDVFFVISGYLITKGILSQQSKGRFDFGDFYTRRVRRLIPALLATIGASFVAAAFLFTPEDFKQMSGSTVYALAGISNFFFWMQSGYFDTAATVKPLLHTWSLSVEIQFYILWPLLLVGITRLTQNVLAATTAIFVAGAAAAYFFLQHDVSGAFFLTPFRIHEFLAGALVVLVERNKVNAALKELAYLAGLALVIAPIFLYSSNGTLFPGLAAIVPVAGAALMIFAGGGAKVAWPCRSWAATKIGEVSYSLYLVHWPIFVFASYVTLNGLKPLATTSLLLLTIALAIVLYALIEKPFRNKSKSKLTGAEFSLATLSVSSIIIVMAASSWGQDGWRWRLPEAIRNIATVDKEKADKYVWGTHEQLTKAKFDNTSKKEKLLVIGDSQAGDVINMLKESGMLEKYDAVSRIVNSRCATPFVEPGQTDTYLTKLNPITMRDPSLIAQCKTHFSNVLDDNLIESADKVFVVFYWRRFAEKYYMQSINEIAKRTKGTVYVFGMKNLSSDSTFIATKFGKTAGLETFASKFVEGESRVINEHMKKIQGTKFVDLMSITCKSKDSCIVLDESNNPIFSDRNHLTQSGAKFFGERLAQALK
ncbi:acyltransferase family protein [Pseudomonas sp. TWI929]|uniref:acyltransferase family protein n=1 Tax=Pseudomonas sp. TWI929 TaxID=3136795 RepID=UPI0032079A19